MNNNFISFDKVLVRDYSKAEWICSFFSHFDGDRQYPYCCLGTYWKYCIPYEGNEHLVGKYDKDS